MADPHTKTTEMPGPAAALKSGKRWLGRSVLRHEDKALLRGTERFIDDIGVRPGTLYAAFVRSPHAHAQIANIDVERALSRPGVSAVVTGSDIAQYTRPFTVGVKAPMQHWSLAQDRVRYQGEPVAIVLATSPYIAEDGTEDVEVTYEPLPAVVDPLAAIAPDAPVLHEALGGNVVADRRYRYGNPEHAFENATRICETTITYPRNSVTPIECYGVVAEFLSGD